MINESLFIANENVFIGLDHRPVITVLIKI